jgi:single-strand DNA-binding protein
MGRLTRDPEIRYVQNGGKAVVKFSIAVNGFKKDDVTFIDCVAWERRGETINQYFKKGQRILVRGRLEIRSYDDKEGTKRKATSLIVDDFDFIEKSQGSGEEAPARASSGSGYDHAGYDSLEDDELPF